MVLDFMACGYHAGEPRFFRIGLGEIKKPSVMHGRLLLEGEKLAAYSAIHLGKHIAAVTIEFA